MHTDTDTVDIDDIDAALDASADDKEQDAAPTFAELGVPKPLVHVLAMDGKVTAFPIQADTLADSLNGVDLLGRGQTGSGKTLAFAIPLVARLSEHSVTEVAMKEFEQIRKASDEKAAREQASLPRPRGLVLAPTRELVNQIDEVIQPLAEAYGMSTVTVYGGVSYARQVAGLRAGADIVVACPGRLEDLLRQGKLSLDAVEITILDEADEMADMGFLPPVTRLLEQTDSRGQRMLFSATLDHGVDALVKRFLPDAKVHAVSSVVSQVDTMTHHVFEVSQGNKHEVIRLLASGTGKRILFTRTKFQAKKMAKKLIDEGIPAVDLQGNLSQKQRDRNLLAFEKGLVRVLVATDVAARGIDVHDVTLVVQTDPPADPKSFLHRSGRTARAGEQGDVVTLVLPNQARSTRQMMKRAGIRVKSVAITPASEDLTELVGEHAPVVEGWSLDKALEALRRSERAGRSIARAVAVVRRAAGGDVPAASPAPVAASMISPVRPHAVTAIVMTAPKWRAARAPNTGSTIGTNRRCRSSARASRTASASTPPSGTVSTDTGAPASMTAVLTTGVSTVTLRVARATRSAVATTSATISTRRLTVARPIAAVTVATGVSTTRRSRTARAARTTTTVTTVVTGGTAGARAGRTVPRARPRDSASRTASATRRRSAAVAEQSLTGRASAASTYLSILPTPGCHI